MIPKSPTKQITLIKRDTVQHKVNLNATISSDVKVLKSVIPVLHKKSNNKDRSSKC